MQASFCTGCSIFWTSNQQAEIIYYGCVHVLVSHLRRSKNKKQLEKRMKTSLSEYTQEQVNVLV